MKKMTPKQKRFVEEYLIDLNATQAAIRAGYSEKTAGQIGEENLKKPEIANEIQRRTIERMKRTELSQDEVIEKLRDLVDICMGKKPIKVMTIVKNAREGTATSVEVEGAMFEPAAANRALELLGRHMRMFIDKVDLTSSDGSLTPVPSGMDAFYADIAGEALKEELIRRGLPTDIHEE
ncbi:terminase small subunit [Oxalobacter vibrioformis]|uniref:Terminase small subunit n=1 Tax=Oxalobacter vibrioformis TaxID=933080 RepID=A0A9E9P5M6_9BURK|nr:terminase small subunit [Oxalobacter vibrioformis]WAW11236.1 terminase small subunit [Oxalobacter vibrioformis]